MTCLPAVIVELRIFAMKGNNGYRITQGLLRKINDAQRSYDLDAGYTHCVSFLRVGSDVSYCPCCPTFVDTAPVLI